MGTVSNLFEEDYVLVQDCIKGDRKSQQKLYNKHGGAMYAICLRYAGNEHDAQDILQNGFIKVFKGLNNFRNEGSFEGWMRRIFVYTSLDFIRNEAKPNFSDFDKVVVKDNDLSGFDKLAMKDLLLIIQSLPEGYRTVVNLFMVEGFMHKEIAEMLGISEGTSKSQLSKGKAALQIKIDSLLN